MLGSRAAISADHGGMAAGRDNITYGTPPDQLAAIIRAAAKAPIDPLPGPIYAGLPDLPGVYRSREADLQALKALLINSDRNAGIVGQSRVAGLHVEDWATQQ